LIWRLSVTPKVQESLPALPPSIKRYVRQALEEISRDPWTGKPLRDELSGLRSFRVRRLRVIYKLREDTRTVMVVGVGSRETIYKETASEIHPKKH
jgi:mRNA interferase RelE/StbE